MRPIRDLSYVFSRGLAVAWLLIVFAPLVLSVLLNTPADGLPLLGIIIWIVLLRLARRLSPAARADALTRKGYYAHALQMAERALAVEGEGAWMGARRLVWLNRRTNALLALGQYDVALASAVEALITNADSETISNCAQALTRLNRYDEATIAARLALALTRERSLSAQTSLAMAMLARGMPAEGEALARAALTDARALMPLVRTEQYATCLATMTRAERLLRRDVSAERSQAELKKVAHKSGLLRAMFILEDADKRSEAPDERERVREAVATARGLAPEYVDWFVTQSSTFAALREESWLLEIVAGAERRYGEFANQAPSPEVVDKAITFATRTGTPRPAAQSSRDALLAQVLTLGATFLLLLFWTWRFFLASA
jgi:tetratricopeptide (TPR) repeat protein